MTKAQLKEYLANIASGKTTLAKLQETLNNSRGMQKTEICNIKDISAITLKENSAYFVENGKLFSLPLKKTRNDGRIAEFVPYYRTLTTIKN